MLTLKTGELRAAVPNLGIEQLLTNDGLVLGWGNYRVLIYIIATHLFAQIGWVGWFFDAENKLFRPFLLVPICFNLYEITVIAIAVNESQFNKPDWKLYTVIIVSILIAVNLYFNSNKALEWMNNDLKLKTKSTS